MGVLGWVLTAIVFIGIVAATSYGIVTGSEEDPEDYRDDSQI